MKKFTDSTALITGASAGLGEEFARQLAPEVKKLILVARRVDRLEKLKSELLQKRSDLQVYIKPVDLSQPGAEKELLGWLGENGLEVDLLVNNAGFGDIGPFASSEWNKIRDMLMVNMVTLTALTHALLPPMLKKKRGTIINVASTAGSIPLPTFAAYAATKAYVCSLDEALHAELRGTGVSITSLCPGPVQTEFSQVATRTGSSRAFEPMSILMVSAEQVVKEAIRGARCGCARVIPGVLVRLGIWFMEILPPFILRIGFCLGGKKLRAE